MIKFPYIYDYGNSYFCPIYHLLIRAPFILISVLGNNSFMRSIPFPAIFPDNSNFPIFTSESSLGISISFVNSIFKLLISIRSNRTGGNSFTLIDIPLPMPSSWASTLNLLNSPLSVSYTHLTLPTN